MHDPRNLLGWASQPTHANGVLDAMRAISGSVLVRAQSRRADWQEVNKRQ
jgi:hypothetical protein